MKPVSFAALAAILVLSGCATDAPKPEQVAAGGTAAPSLDDRLTGSRIPARRTEKMVGQIGAKDYNEAKQATVAPLKGG